MLLIHSEEYDCPVRLLVYFFMSLSVFFLKLEENSVPLPFPKADSRPVASIRLCEYRSTCSEPCPAERLKIDLMVFLATK
jgi:hypothetical protein